MSGKRAANERQGLRECPLCGGKAYVARGMRDRAGLWHSAVLCEDHECGASVPCTPATDPSDSMRSATDRWNRRHERTCRNVSSEPDMFQCSECGFSCDFGLSYCGGCGARVVKG